MNKEIYFCVDLESYDNFAKNMKVFMATSYDGMKRALERNTINIATTSLAHLSFDLIDQGYDIYLCYKDKELKIEDGMKLSNGATMRIEGIHDLLDIFLAGNFDELLGIKK